MSDTLARNVASGRIGNAEAEWLRQGFGVWLSNRGALPLDRCLRLPTSHTKMAQAERDMHLRTAWELIDKPGPWLKSVELAAEILRFETQLWPRWRRDTQPPAGASALRTTLFWALRSGAKMPTSTQQVHNICSPATK